MYGAFLLADKSRFAKILILIAYNRRRRSSIESPLNEWKQQEEDEEEHQLL